MKIIRMFFLALSLFCLPFFAIAEPLDINTASAKELAIILDGVGPKIADRIIAYRNENGSFKSIDDLMKVKGIGKSTLEKNKDRIKVNNDN